MELVSIINMICMIFTVAQNCSLISGTVGNSFSGTSCNDSVILPRTVGNSLFVHTSECVDFCSRNCSLILGTVGNSLSGSCCIYREIELEFLGNSWEQFCELLYSVPHRPACATRDHLYIPSLSLSREREGIYRCPVARRVVGVGIVLKVAH